MCESRIKGVGNETVKILYVSDLGTFNTAVCT
jgi:hypothetical protein